MGEPEVTTFTAMALQLDCVAVNGCADRTAASALMQATIKKTAGALAVSAAFNKGFSGADTKLVVLPEYFLSSFPMGEPIAKWRELAAIAQDGPEYAALGAIAQKHACYLAGNAYEIDPKFPELYFQVCFIIAPSGNVALRYRRLISMYAPSPFDVWDKFLDAYGLEAAFPVLRTEIGNLACVASEEILYPEITRAMAVRGAEIICQPTSETGSPRPTPKSIARQARAIENMVYVIACNTARIVGTPMPEDATGGKSTVVDYKGAVLSEANTGETFSANAVLDMAALRTYRGLPGMGNYLSRQPLELYSASLAGRTFAAPNGLLQGGKVVVPDRAFFVDRQVRVMARMKKDGVL